MNASPANKRSQKLGFQISFISCARMVFAAGADEEVGPTVAFGSGAEI